MVRSRALKRSLESRRWDPALVDTNTRHKKEGHRRSAASGTFVLPEAPEASTRAAPIQETTAPPTAESVRVRTAKTEGTQDANNDARLYIFSSKRSTDGNFDNTCTCNCAP